MAKVVNWLRPRIPIKAHAQTFMGIHMVQMASTWAAASLPTTVNWLRVVLCAEYSPAVLGPRLLRMQRLGVRPNTCAQVVAAAARLRRRTHTVGWAQMAAGAFAAAVAFGGRGAERWYLLCRPHAGVADLQHVHVRELRVERMNIASCPITRPHTRRWLAQALLPSRAW
jgi:hypothetical protein|eukprot:COSAG01_NODE_196_length_22350_cov_812.929136_6_plen_169_part_00